MLYSNIPLHTESYSLKFSTSETIYHNINFLDDFANKDIVIRTSEKMCLKKNHNYPNLSLSWPGSSAILTLVQNHESQNPNDGTFLILSTNVNLFGPAITAFQSTPSQDKMWHQLAAYHGKEVSNFILKAEKGAIFRILFKHLRPQLLTVDPSGQVILTPQSQYPFQVIANDHNWRNL